MNKNKKKNKELTHQPQMCCVHVEKFEQCLNTCQMAHVFKQCSNSSACMLRSSNSVQTVFKLFVNTGSSWSGPDEEGKCDSIMSTRKLSYLILEKLQRSHVMWSSSVSLTSTDWHMTGYRISRIPIDSSYMSNDDWYIGQPWCHYGVFSLIMTSYSMGFYEVLSDLLYVDIWGYLLQA